MDVLRIKTATEEDLDDIMAIEQRVFPDPWTRTMFADQLDLPRLYTFVSAKVGDDLVGYGGILKIKDEGHLTNLAVKPEWQSLGIGKSLVYFLSLVAKTEGISSIMLEVRTPNTAAQELYKKFGFEITTVRKNYYGFEDDAYVMAVYGVERPEFMKLLEDIRKTLKYNIEDYVDVAG